LPLEFQCCQTEEEEEEEEELETVLASDCNNDRQTEIAIWLPKPEIIILLEL